MCPKCRRFSALHSKFYAQNVCELWKSRIKIRANNTVNIHASKAVKLAANNLSYTNDNVSSDGNDESKNNYVNVGLIEFGLHTKTLLKDNIKRHIIDELYIIT